MSFRIEKKYRLTATDWMSLRAILSNLGMKPLFPQREVSSCYFDTISLNCFHDSEEGLLPRKKIRIRWYEQEFKFMKETKVSSVEGRYKISDNMSQCLSLTDVLSLQPIDNFYGVLNPSLIVRYVREYFALKNLRLTFDRDISYFNPSQPHKIVARDKERVMEIKTQNLGSEDNLLTLIPHSTERFSKYCRGVRMSNTGQ